MLLPRVLVLEPQAFQRGVLVKMLQRLGACRVLHAADAQEATVQLYESGGADVVLCDVGSRNGDYLDFLGGANELGLLRAVVLCNVSKPELQRAIGRMATFSGLRLLGVFGAHVHLHSLQKVLRRYRRAPIPDPGALPSGLPGAADVRRGLAAGEFHAWFQPKFTLATGRVTGLEVLARWEHPERGLLLPEDFLAAVLAYDLTDRMFTCLLEQGLDVLKALRGQGVDLELAFNLHASQLVDNTLVEHIRETLQRHGLPTSVLTFELAENGLLALAPRTLKSLLRLRLLGFSLCIDDFAQGFSSMKRLTCLPFNQVKIDSALLAHRDDAASRALIASTLALTRALEINLIVKGISDAGTHAMLLNAGCEVGQGFFLLRPMTGRGLLQWMKTQSQF